MLPAPIPMARKAQSSETPLSSERNTSLPKYCRSVLSSTPVNQKYDTPRTASQSGLSCRRWRVLPAISPKGFHWKVWVAPEAGTRVMRRLAAKPITAMASVAAPIRPGAAFHTANSTPPPAMPSTMATKVLISSSALPRERSRSPSISGTMPYLAGLKMAACNPIRKTTSSMPSVQLPISVASPKSMMAISKSLTPTSTRRLLTRSARWPEYPLNSSDGRVKTAGTSGT